MADTPSDNDLDSAALAVRDAACEALEASLSETLGGEGGAAPETLGAFVRDLFARYFAVSQTKGEDPEDAARKIARIVAQKARQAFPPPPAAVAAPPAAAPAAEAASEGRVTGRTAGLDRRLLGILSEVSAFYGTPIAVLSGRRSPKQQAQAMYTNWQSHLRRGKDNAFLAGREKLRRRLDELKQEKDKPGFLALLDKEADWDAVSRHISGDEADLAPGTDPAVLDALASCLNHRSGRNSEGARCHHFDTAKLVWPITDAVRAKWRRP